MHQVEARALKLGTGGRDGFRAGHLELDRRLRDHQVGGPLSGAEACFGGLRERPETEVLAAGDAAAGVVAVALPLQGQPESVDEQLATRGRIGDDNRHARDEENVRPGCPFLLRRRA
ncbi:hypothetical protein [Streptomyces sp. NPDC057616]|uniref:hypothetical protein n=1 Tax=Streptomyces sp. NPDC057616 TaxID=3346183 RepID=UPI0036C0EA2F